MTRLRDSIATRLALGFGILVSVTVSLVAIVFYFATMGALDSSVDEQIHTLSSRLATTYRERPLAELVDDIDEQLEDGSDSDAEIFLVLTPDGRRLAGNVPEWEGEVSPPGEVLSSTIDSPDGTSEVRYMLTELNNGRMLLVGFDLSEQAALRLLVQRALVAGALAALLLTVVGSVYFRHQIERRIGDIRRAARDIELGNLHRRIAISGQDEFQRLGLDINRMLDRIQQLMEGVRHVSNSIAHDLRTPLSRIRNRLESALRQPLSIEAQRSLIVETTEHIDELLLLFNKLLQIAEAESGMRPAFSERVDLAALAQDLYELYDASAEDAKKQLKLQVQAGLSVNGDRDLLANALASLLDNALKYAGANSTVTMEVCASGGQALLMVKDEGPGIAESELNNVTRRFYRLDHSRSKPGNGLGLSIVKAIANLHGGTLHLRNLHPGLEVALALPLPTSI
jgi:signal transduction histidine kinase